MELFRADSRANLFDLERVVSRFGKLRACNPQMQYLARMEWHERLLPHIADELFRYINALLGRSKKCLVVDLDNTLWGGVLGEEGPEGVAVGNSGAQAEAYQAFQHAVLALKERGIILAINSKNNRDDVVELFEKRAMPLKLNEFSAIEINWNHKHENLKRIAKILNIGADSLVFVDDNPAEVRW
jgi:HAD superfamily phosphatase (TIGR01681 family)